MYGEMRALRAGHGRTTAPGTILVPAASRAAAAAAADSDAAAGAGAGWEQAPHRSRMPCCADVT